MLKQAHVKIIAGTCGGLPLRPYVGVIGLIDIAPSNSHFKFGLRQIRLEDRPT